MNERLKKIAGQFNRAPEILSCASYTPDWLKLTARYLGFQQSGFPFIAKFRDGSTFEFQDLPDVATWWQIFCRGIYPVQANDRIIIDAGANIGAFTLYALKQAPQARVIAVEPFPSTFARLTAAVERCPSRARVDLLNIALAAGCGTVTMQDGPMASQFRSVLSDTSSSQHGTAVVSCPLSKILARAGGEIDLLKMDIEGSEYASLLTSPPQVLRRIRRIAMELHPLNTPEPAQTQDLFRHLKEAGFEAIDVQDHGGGYGMAYLRRN